ncbi:hypothetical protein [Mycobacterium sp. DBP42]|uniref:hypothetical protein n=1 Tax=Mycobacteriaceae TaxID=1762 RepID=UPI00110D172B|nr:hypothetical protein [Mycobacterium sp. DBP42]TMS46983.1 hypothetical protein E0T84_29420 [Mycobacterium sp. DBP42]
MTAAPLTEDQRWLLRAVGGRHMHDCLIGPDGVAELMQSMCSSTGAKVDGGPDCHETDWRPCPTCGCGMP